MKTSQKNDEVYKALFEVSKLVTNIERAEDNPFLNSKYVPLDRILEVVRDPLAGVQLMLAQSPSFKDGNVTVETRLIHALSSQWVSVSPSSPVVPAKIDRKVEGLYVTPQGVGAAITYLRRYGLMSLLGLAETDDDGNLASGTPRDERSSWTGPLDLEALTKELRSLWGKIEKVQDLEKLDQILWGYQETVSQCKADLPDRWDGTDGIKGIQTLIDGKREKLKPHHEPMAPDQVLEEIENRISGVTSFDDLEAVRKDYDNHTALEMPDYREKAQDLFNIKMIEIKDESTNTKNPEIDKPSPEPEDRAETAARLKREVMAFEDKDDLAAWSDSQTETLDWIAERSKSSKDEINSLIVARLKALGELEDA